MQTVWRSMKRSGAETNTWAIDGYEAVATQANQEATLRQLIATRNTRTGCTAATPVLMQLSETGNKQQSLGLTSRANEMLSDKVRHR